VHIKLFASRDHTQCGVAGIVAKATRPTIEIGPLNLYRTHHGFDGAADAFSGLQHLVTPGTGDLVAVVFTTVDMRHDRLGKTPSELLAQSPHRCGHLHEG